MALDGEYDPQNIFAKILRGEAPCVRVFEDDAVLSFMDIFPQTRGHTLVLPKSPARNLFDVSEDALTGVISRTRMIAAAVREALQPDGVRIVQFNGTPAGQTVFHLHFHILPVFDGEDFGAHASGGPADAGELEKLAERIRAAI